MRHWHSRNTASGYRGASKTGKKRTELDFDCCQRAHQQAMYMVRRTAHHLVGISGLGMREL